MRTSVLSWPWAALLVLVAPACSMPSTDIPSGHGASGGSQPGGTGGRSAGGGGASGSGGASASGGSSGQGGSSASGGSAGRGGASGSGGPSTTGGAAGSGGVGAGGAGGRGGAAGSGGAGGAGGRGGASSFASGGARGGAGGSGGTSSSGGMTGAGGTTASGGRTGSGGAGGAGGASSNGGSGGTTVTGGSTGSGDCSITITSSGLSTAMATVGVVEWSTSLSGLASARIVYTLNNAAASVLNQGGVAPVDLKKAGYRTLLLGLKPSSTYTFHVEATSSSGATCKSADNTITTKTLSAPTVNRTAANASAQAVGFIVTSTGQSGGGGGATAYIIDADGTVVWAAAAPSQCSRAHMDFEGNNLWMLALNVGNSGGEMRFVSMDGLTSKNNVSGLSAAHHDFTVVPGKIAAMVWATAGTRDPESNLVEMAADGSGSATTVFKIGSNLYAGGGSALGGGSGSYHCNHIIYHPDDDSFTIADRNPNLVVKAKHDGTPVWQIGGSCTGAKAPKCASGTWQVNHGQDLDGQGNMLIFNNGQSGAAHVLELKLNETTSAISYTTAKDFTSGSSSNVLGDVQFLPNGNILVTYSTGGTILEVDSSWATVQTLKASFGYSDWRQTLYGPPTRK